MKCHRLAMTPTHRVDAMATLAQRPCLVHNDAPRTGIVMHPRHCGASCSQGLQRLIRTPRAQPMESNPFLGFGAMLNEHMRNQLCWCCARPASPCATRKSRKSTCRKDQLSKSSRCTSSPSSSRAKSSLAMDREAMSHTVFHSVISTWSPRWLPVLSSAKEDRRVRCMTSIGQTKSGNDSGVRVELSPKTKTTPASHEGAS